MATLIKEQGLASTTRLASKIITATRDMTAASGDVAYTGVGFTPTSIIAICSIEGSIYSSWGMADGAKTLAGMYAGSSGAAGYFADTGGALIFSIPAGGYQSAIVKTYDADGFTLTWTKTSSPTGTLNLRFLCFR